MPVSNGVYPSTNWKYCVSRNVAPNMAKNTIMMPMLAAVNRGFWKKCTSSIGWSVCASHAKNAPSTTTPMPNVSRIVLSPQPSVGASMIP